MPFFLIAKRVFADTGLFQQEALDKGSECNMAEEQLSKTGTAAYFESSIVTWEEKTGPIAGNAAEVSDEGAFQRRESGRLEKVPHLPLPLQRLKSLLIVLLCVSFLTAVLKKRAALTKQDEDRMRETRARLKKIEVLLSAAEKLSIAVNTEEARNLMKTLRGCLAKKDTGTAERRNIEKVEASLANALKALRRLHQAALKKADAIVQADRAVPELSTLGFSRDEVDEALLNYEQRCMQPTVCPLIKTYRSLLKSAAALPKRIQAIASRLSFQRPFENEADEDVLLSTAAAFEALRATSACRKRLANVGQEMSNAVLEGVKLSFITSRERALLYIKGEVQLLGLRCALKKNAAIAGKGFAPAQPSDTGTGEVAWAAVEKSLTNVEALLAQLRSNVEALRKSTSLVVAALTARESFETEKNARSLLLKCFELNDLLRSNPQFLDGEAFLMAKHMGISNAEAVRRESELLKKSLQKMLKILGEGNDSFSPTRSSAFNKFLTVTFIEQAKATAAVAEMRRQNTAKVLESLKKAKGVSGALEDLTKLSMNCFYQTVDRGRLHGFELSARLLAFLVDDVEHWTTQADSMASQISQLPGCERSKFKNLQQEFNAARKNVEDARTLTAAASAAAHMRAHLLAMQELLFPATTENQS